MSIVTLAGGPVEVDQDGFLVESDAWTPAIAEDLAGEVGIELTPRHWEVIEFCRKDFEAKGASPTVRRITKFGGVTTKEMYQLFPKGPGLLAAKLSGLTKPKGCI